MPHSPLWVIVYLIAFVVCIVVLVKLLALI